MKRFFLFMLLLMFGLPVFAQDASTGINTYYQMLFGTPDQENYAIGNDGVHDVSQESCNSYGGVIGVVNTFFCNMEQSASMTALGDFTKMFGNYEIHAEFSLAPITLGSYNYAYQGFIWECDTSSTDCTQTSNYQQAYYMAFSFDPGGGVNNGYIITEPGLFSGQSGTALQIQYDVGSTTVNPFLQVQGIFVSGTDTYAMWAAGVETPGVSLQLDLAAYDQTASAGYRFALSTTPDIADTKYFNLYYEDTSGASSCSTVTNGYCSIDNSASGITMAPATGNGLCLYSNDYGSSIADNIVGSSACGALGFTTFSDFALTTDGTPSAQALTQSAILSAPGSSWNGMPATPSSL